MIKLRLQLILNDIWLEGAEMLTGSVDPGVGNPGPLSADWNPFTRALNLVS